MTDNEPVTDDEAGGAFGAEVADIHRMFRREFDLLPDVILAVPDGDEARARVVGSWVWEVLDSLHHYRQAQSSTLWPALQQRLPSSAGDDGRPAAVVARAQQRLAALDSPRERAQGAALRWQDGGRATDAKQCGTTIEAMRQPLLAALDLVEWSLAPLIDRHLNGSERSALVTAAWLGARGRRRRAILGGVLEGTREPELVLSHAPAVLRWLAAPAVVEPHVRRMTIVRQRGPID